MDLNTTAEVYMPSVDETGRYVDRVPSIGEGLRCMCGARRDKVYGSYSVFAAHVKTKTHQRWLEGLNANRMNYYVENMELRSLVQTQREIIGEMDKKMTSQNVVIGVLSEELTRCRSVNNHMEVDDLIDFD